MFHFKAISKLILFLLLFCELSGQSIKVVRDTTGSEIPKADFYFGFAYRDVFGSSQAGQIKQDTTVFQIDKNGQILNYIAAYKATNEYNQLLYVRPNDILYFKITESGLELNVPLEKEKQVLQSLDKMIKSQERRLPQAYQLSNMDALLDSLETNISKQRDLIDKYCTEQNLDPSFAELLTEYINVYFTKIAFTNFNVCSPIIDFSEINTRTLLVERLRKYKKLLLINAQNFTAIQHYSTACINYLRYLNYDNLNEQGGNKTVLEAAVKEFEEPYLSFILMKLLISMAGDTSLDTVTFEKYVDLCRNKEYQAMAIEFRDELLKRQKYSTVDEVNLVVMETGKPSTLHELTARSSKKLFYLDFWASWCAACKVEHKKMKQAISEHQDIEFVSVNIDETFEKGKIASAAWEIGKKNSFYIDPNSTFAQAFAKPSIPRFVIFDRNLTVINANAPRPSDPKLKELFDELLR